MLAQALFHVRATRSPKELRKFVDKLRVYTISDQDDSGPWIRKNFPTLFYIASPGFHGGGAYHHSTWSGISGDKFHGRFAGADFAIVDNPWLNEHIRAKGPLGAQHPLTKFMMEGDTPSFLSLIDNGLMLPSIPTGAAGAADTSSTRRAWRNGSTNPRRVRSGPMPRTKCSASTATGTPLTRPRSGAGARHSKTISKRAWTGPSSHSPRRIIRRLRAQPCATQHMSNANMRDAQAHHFSLVARLRRAHAYPISAFMAEA